MRRRYRFFFRVLVLATYLLSACGKVGSLPDPTLSAPFTPTLLPGTPSLTTTPAPTSIPLITPTLNPDLPCGGVMPEHLYLFMDCNDIRRIRAAFQSKDPGFMADWLISKEIVDDYLERFPTQYDPDASWGVLWSGAGNFIARDMALLYLVTGDQIYSNAILKLLELVRANTPVVSSLTNFDMPNGRGRYMAGGTISHPSYGAVVIQSALFAYLSIRDTILIDDELRSTYDHFFQLQGELYEQAAIQRGNDVPLDGIINRNVPFAANLVALTIARTFPEEPEMQALDARVLPRLNWQLENWWEEDGGWGENTQNYGFSRLESLLILAEISLRNSGPDLYAQDFNGRTILSMCRFFLDTVTPVGTVPALNDTDHYPVDPGLFRLCGFRTNDPQLYYAEKMYNSGRNGSFGIIAAKAMTPFHLLAWVNLGEEPSEIPEYTSVLLPSTGAAILRNGWTRDDQYGLLQFTASRVHEEYSYGALYLFSHGPWLVGNGYHIPDARPTNQHSTLGMDNTDQTYTGGDPIAFADLGKFGIAGVTSHSYPNLQHTRLVLWIEPWSQWVVVDDAIGDNNTHLLQQRWYVYGSELSAKDNIWIYGQDDNNYRLTIQMTSDLPANYSRIEREYDVEKFLSDSKGVSMDINYPGKPVRLVTSLSVTERIYNVPSFTRTDGPDGTQLDGLFKGMTWTWILPGISNTSGTAGDYEISGIAGCAYQEAGNLQGYCLMNGSVLTVKGQTLVESSENLYLETDFADGKIFLDTMAETTIFFLWTTPIESISESGTDLLFTIDQGLVTLQISPGHHILEVK